MNEKDKFAFDTGRTIGKLEAEVEKFRVALTRIAEYHDRYSDPSEYWIDMQGIAKEALK